MSTSATILIAVAPPLVGGGVAWLAWRAGSLSVRGAQAAAAVGALALWAGWRWGAYVLCWFVIASAASRLGRRRKQQHTAGVIAKGGARDAWQVLANGGVFAIAAAAFAVLRDFGEPSVHNNASLHLLALMGAASLAAAGADTLATEIGTWCGGVPWSLRTGRTVAAGTSGAVSLWGTLAMIGAAALFGALALLVGPVVGGVRPATGVLVAAAGLGGALADTLAGAWLQQERWCPTCESSTEQLVHVCGAPTVVQRGLAWLSNDAVNLVCTVTGALFAWLLAWRWGMA